MASTTSRRPLLSLVEEATHLLRRAPATAWLGYCVGSAPFVVHLFFFWSDMSRSALAWNHVLESSFILAVLLMFVMLVAQFNSLYQAFLIVSLVGARSPDAAGLAGSVAGFAAAAFFNTHFDEFWVIAFWAVAIAATLPQGFGDILRENVARPRMSRARMRVRNVT